MTNWITLHFEGGDEFAARDVHWDVSTNVIAILAQSLVVSLGPAGEGGGMPDAEALLARVRERLESGKSYHLAADLGRILDPDGRDDELAMMPISELDLSVRMLNALRYNGIETVADLDAWTFWDITGIRNIGRISMAELVVELRTIGVTLKDTPDDFPGDVVK